jgi:uncharacterized protein
MNKRKSTLSLILPIILAFILWYFAFSFPKGIFWVKLSISAVVLAIYAVIISKDNIKKQFSFVILDIVLGAASAAVLYLLFFLGKLILGLILPGSEMEIDSVYQKGEGFSPIAIALLLLLVTSPAEEIFWRGYIQEGITRKLKPVLGIFLTTLVYALVHVWTMNLTLVLAAFTAGLFWGILYYWRKSLVLNIISHALWTWSIFILFPMA